MIKVFGIGNILLGDDGIGVYVIENIKEKLLKLNKNINVIIGETDYLYCLEEISKDDFVIIVDSTYFVKKAGTITLFDLKECDHFIDNINSQHEINLVKALRCEKSYIKGYLIGVEVHKVEYSLEISNELKKEFDILCKEIFYIIEKISSNTNII